MRDINLGISQGELVGILGASGCGKTTLAQHFNGLLKPESGRVLVNEADLWRHSQDLSALRRRIGMVFQFPESQFFSDNVFDELAFGPHNLDLSEAEIAGRVDISLRSVGLNPSDFLRSNPLALSAGEQRLVAIASVLAMMPEWLIFDEPTAGLDRPGEEAVTALVRKLSEDGKTVILISHDVDLVFALCERIVLLEDGRVVFDGAGSNLLADENKLKSSGYTIPRPARISRYLNMKGLIEQSDLVSLIDIKRAIKTTLGSM